MRFKSFQHLHPYHISYRLSMHLISGVKSENDDPLSGCCLSFFPAFRLVSLKRNMWSDGLGVFRIAVLSRWIFTATSPTPFSKRWDENTKQHLRLRVSTLSSKRGLFNLTSKVLREELNNDNRDTHSRRSSSEISWGLFLVSCCRLCHIQPALRWRQTLPAADRETWHLEVFECVWKQQRSL